MADRKCERCGKVFSAPCRLQAHRRRKTPCDPIIEASRNTKAHSCKYCGRSYTTPQALSRHVRHSCKIANSEEGMEKLVEHTLQRQNSELAAKLDRLTAIVENMALGQSIDSQLAVGGQGAASRARQIAQHVERAGQVNNGPVTNVQNIVNINAWDGDRRIAVDVADVVAAFAGNARLQEYARLGDHELTDPEIAPPYVTELLMDLTKRAHADPSARNVYLNPRRADQALVHMQSGRWEVVPLAEATRLLFDGVAKGILSISRLYEERRQLPAEAQNALSMAGLLYDDEPAEYAKRAKAPMAAHLANMAPSRPALSAP
jgi:hypothetical protein